MFFQIYGETAGWQLLGWLLVFAGLVVMNEIARRSKAGGIACFLILPAALSVYFIAIYVGAAMGSSMPTIAEPTAQGIISVLSFAVNVFVFAYILKRAKVQKKNPWKNEIFTDTKDYKEAMERA